MTHEALTTRQQEILDFIRARWMEGDAPSFQDIARHFGFRSPNAVTDHVKTLVRKGALEPSAGKARSLRPTGVRKSPVREIPIYGNIPAGFAEGRDEESEGCVTIDVATLGIRANSRTFALRVRGDSMIGKHICDGDIVVCEHGVEPSHGDIVAALIDNESTLKSFIMNRRRPYLQAENPAYPDLLPADELVIQGVVVSVIRQVR